MFGFRFRFMNSFIIRPRSRQTNDRKSFLNPVNFVFAKASRRDLARLVSVEKQKRGFGSLTSLWSNRNFDYQRTALGPTMDRRFVFS